MAAQDTRSLGELKTRLVKAEAPKAEEKKEEEKEESEDDLGFSLFD